MERKTKIVRENLSRRVEVDVSGAVADTGVASVFAYSNGCNASVLISPKTKKLALKCYRLIHKGDPAPDSFYFYLYVTGLILLLKPHIKKFIDLILDTELYGQDEKIRSALFVWSNGIINSRFVSFKQIGKKSKAHILAISVFRGEIKPDKILSLEDIRGYLKQQKRPVAPRVKATF